MFKCYFIECYVSSAKDKLCITAPPGGVAYSVTSTCISFFIAQQDITTHLFELQMTVSVVNHRAPRTFTVNELCT